MALVFFLMVIVSQAAGGAPGAPGDLTANGRSWEQFLQSTRIQRDLWLKTDARVSIAPDLVARVERVRRGLQLVVVTEDWCPDSAYTVPYVARLATLAGVPLHLVDRAAGEAWLQAHRTRDGRTATPTIVVLRYGVDVGAWVERPAVLQDLFRSIGDNPAAASQFARRGEWYEADHGATALREIVTVIERTGAQR